MSEEKKIRSVGIIMDGNRRWAKARGLSGVDGYKEGVEVIKRLGKRSGHLNKKYGLEFITLYTFSTENWNRPPEEVEYLMNLIRSEFEHITDELDKENIRVRIIGNTIDFSKDIQIIFSGIEEKTKNNTGITAVFALSYGGRAEIIQAVNRAVHTGEEISDEQFSDFLYTKGIKDPDIIIRTSNERRLSGFLPWQSVYSELFFIEEHWPDFTIEKLEEIFAEYQKRDRRYGK